MKLNERQEMYRGTGLMFGLCASFLVLIYYFIPIGVIFAVAFGFMIISIFAFIAMFFDIPV